MKTHEVVLDVPEGFQVIIGQAHFIKTVEDLYEALVTSMPGIKFGVAFCEASGKSLIRSDGSDASSVQAARAFAMVLAAGHCFVVVLKDAYPINVLSRIKAVEEVVAVFCATSNRVTVLVAENGQGRGIIGVIDGSPPRGHESEEDARERREFLRKIGYKR